MNVDLRPNMSDYLVYNGLKCMEKIQEVLAVNFADEVKKNPILFGSGAGPQYRMKLIGICSLR